MSGAASGPLTEAERVDVRRFLGHSVRGWGPTTDPFGRWFVQDPTLEWRLSNLSTDELPILRAKLADLARLDAAIVGAGEGLDTAAAGPWTRNPAEMAERRALFQARRADLAEYLGVAMSGSARTNGLRLVV